MSRPASISSVARALMTQAAAAVAEVKATFILPAQNQNGELQTLMSLSTAQLLSIFHFIDALDVGRLAGRNRGRGGIRAQIDLRGRRT